jgi:hypothetical protein
MRHVADVARVVASPLLVRREELPGIEAHAVTCRWNGERPDSSALAQPS